MDHNVSVEILILGKGFVGQYTYDLCKRQDIAVAATTRDGRDGTYAWSLESSTESLPTARTVVITFPVRTGAELRSLVEDYNKLHSIQPQYIFLSSTRPFDKLNSTRHSPVDSKHTRFDTENAVFEAPCNGSVLHLSGLWGGSRQPRNWLRFFMTPEKLKNAIIARQLHLIHGADVAKAIVNGLHRHFTPGERWLLSDGKVYDRLELVRSWNNKEQVEIIESLREDPAVASVIGTQPFEDIVVGAEKIDLPRRLNPDEFWEHFQLSPDYYFDPYSQEDM
ncbi:hypothetical protein K493DRAFT_287689 [Basidiobolus meristosporus CBS 931.73]|uniref:NAD(P)-binding protein n=1 Tax=Basidiobolus meristosporus CBS 931.73 TaxID=1314790 RepID=A0A1Y1XYC6_9FUNG|nr:hypothetical protein K493DRAFT_287689 [Basidiobolus meristosporus CBS 931.73]|eukprot:ORX90757.1 hypothetical protein K493DRAFT_287689 [Basidiobolus meristosporus CBS 931.73]